MVPCVHTLLIHVIKHNKKNIFNNLYLLYKPITNNLSFKFKSKYTFHIKTIILYLIRLTHYKKKINLQCSCIIYMY